MLHTRFYTPPPLHHRPPLSTAPDSSHLDPPHSRRTGTRWNRRVSVLCRCRRCNRRRG
ncbi:hypothetical protein HanRHA438_Chr16g0748401 [Helianthus annuus]|nr:hypothetical protein HanIR_Chr16g0800251 [Helianthus annuus]KAJ0834854.1 hypothetical protein HanRHA438_Chr16g0748401 [Helianthus annuus]